MEPVLLHSTHGFEDSRGEEIQPEPLQLPQGTDQLFPRTLPVPLQLGQCIRS